MNVILVISDTLRYDHIGAHGAGTGDHFTPGCLSVMT